MERDHLLIFIIIMAISVLGFLQISPGIEKNPSDLTNDLIVIAEGEALMGDDTTLAQAKAMALNNARRNALEQATGVKVHGSTVIYNSDLISDLVVTATKGLIVKEEIIKEEGSVTGKQISYYYKIKAYVKPLDIKKRGNLQIIKAEVFRAGTNQLMQSPVFQHDDEIQIKIKVNEDAYINIFSVSQDGRISMLFPNEYFKAEILPANREFIFPDETQRMLGVKLRAKTEGKLSKAVESVLIIATKEKVNFLSDKDIQEPTITDLMRELSEIDLSLWAEKTIGYEVRR